MIPITERMITISPEIPPIANGVSRRVGVRVRLPGMEREYR
jgi:hypothetical protein